MPTVQLNKPYKISFHKLKRYTAHYGIPADKCVVIPKRYYDEDVACDVRWEDNNGELQVKELLFFASDNIEPVNALSHFHLYELWQHYHGSISPAPRPVATSE